MKKLTGCSHDKLNNTKVDQANVTSRLEKRQISRAPAVKVFKMAVVAIFIQQQSIKEFITIRNYSGKRGKKSELKDSQAAPTTN